MKEIFGILFQISVETKMHLIMKARKWKVSQINKGKSRISSNLILPEKMGKGNNFNEKLVIIFSFIL